MERILAITLAILAALFRSHDIESMKPFGIDLSSYDDVKKHAQDIYARLFAKKHAVRWAMER